MDKKEIIMILMIVLVMMMISATSMFAGYSLKTTTQYQRCVVECVDLFNNNCEPKGQESLIGGDVIEQYLNQHRPE